MSKVNRPDTLHTELRELRRRVRLLEARAGRAPGIPGATEEPAPPEPDGGEGDPVDAALGSPDSSAAPALVPARTRDWWSIDSVGWETIAAARLSPGGPESIVVLRVGEGHGAIRVAVDGVPVTEDLEVRAPRGVYVLHVPIPPGQIMAARELTIHASGSFRLYATLHA